jgi:ribosomal protein S18 acetylase RimI-like enzyme
VPLVGATIREALTPGDIALARALFVEYAQWLNVDLCFQGFDAELKRLPGAYAPPRGRLLVVGLPGAAFGCIALRPLGQGGGCGNEDAGNADPSIGEVKRLYVQPGHRGERWGHRLASTLIGHAIAIGYRELKLDTLGRMEEARALYAKLGFRECAAYYDNPLPDVVYMSLSLSASGAASAAR